MMVRKGFTLAEVLIVAIIISILMGVMLAAVIQSHAIIETTNTLTLLRQEKRLAVSKLSNELRNTSLKDCQEYTSPCEEGRCITITQDSPASGTDKIEYCLPADSDHDGVPDLSSDCKITWCTKHTIELDTSSHELKRNNVTVLARYVKNIRFLDHSLQPSLYLNELKVTLEMEKTSYQGRVYNISSTFIIYVRN